MKWQTLQRVIYIYIKSQRKNKLKENLLKKRILFEVKGGIGERSAIGILEHGCYIPKVKQLIWRLEWIKDKKGKHEVSILFN